MTTKRFQTRDQIELPRTQTFAYARRSLGDVFSTGVFGGAYVDATWRVIAVDGTTSTAERVTERSVRNADGTFSTVYEAVA